MNGPMLHAPVAKPEPEKEASAPSLFAQARSAVIWRSGAQIVGQMITWAATFLVIRILDPHDYGLFAMTQVVLAVLNMLNGAGLASGLIQKPDADVRTIRQLYGMLIVLNFGLGAVQFAIAPLVAAYFHQPIVADLLRVQSFLYVTTPFVAFPYALLARAIDFRVQAKVYLASGDHERASEVLAMAPPDAKDPDLDSVRAALAIPGVRDRQLGLRHVLAGVVRVHQGLQEQASAIEPAMFDLADRVVEQDLVGLLRVLGDRVVVLVPADPAAAQE